MKFAQSFMKKLLKCKFPQKKVLLRKIYYIPFNPFAKTSRYIFRLEDRENRKIPINHLTDIEYRVCVLTLIRQNTFPPQNADSLVVVSTSLCASE